VYFSGLQYVSLRHVLRNSANNTSPICLVAVCVAVCCSVLQCAAVCCSVLQCVAVRCSVCCSVLQCFAVCCSVLQCLAVCCSVLQCVAVCCSVLQCVTVCCSGLQCAAMCCSVHTRTHTHTHTPIHTYTKTCSRAICCVRGSLCEVLRYGVATISRHLKIIGLFCRISSLLQGYFAKETSNFEKPTNHNHPICQFLFESLWPVCVYVCVCVRACVHVCVYIYTCVCIHMGDIV